MSLFHNPPQKKVRAKYLLSCIACGTKRWMDDPSLVEITLRPIQGKIPIIDAEGKKTAPEPRQQNQIFKCNACGMLTILEAEKKKTEDSPAPVHSVSCKGCGRKLDDGNKEAPMIEDQKRERMFKCKGCGRGVVARKYNVPDSVVDKEKNEKEDLSDGRENRFTRPEI
jgi:DNA-directed RNA polymerase subunit M/transcription elongation factor TFIIS